MTAPADVTIAVSECLLGRAVRWDATSYDTSFIGRLCRPWLRFRGICPEIGIGMSTPRAPIQLVDRGGTIRATDVATGERDHTDALERFAGAQDLSAVAGYVFTEKSPSCGLERVKVFRSDGRAFERKGRGIYSRVIVTKWPHLPVTDARMLDGEDRLDRFLRRVIAYDRWRDERARGGIEAYLGTRGCANVVAAAARSRLSADAFWGLAR